VEALLTAGDDVTVLDSMEPGVHTGPPRLPTGVDLVVADVRDPAAVRAALAGVDVVVHLAAKVGLGVELADMTGYAARGGTTAPSTARSVPACAAGTTSRPAGSSRRARCVAGR